MSIQDIKNVLLNESQPPLANSIPAQPALSPPPAYTYWASKADMAQRFEEVLNDESELSPINIFISAPVTIVGNGNLVAVDPTQTATNVAHSIARAFKEGSVCSTGIPMIDEEGRPRPIKVQVDAALRVDGIKNTIGEKAVLYVLQSKFNTVKRRRDEARDDGETDDLKENETGAMAGEAKRQRIA